VGEKAGWKGAYSRQRDPQSRKPYSGWWH